MHPEKLVERYMSAWNRQDAEGVLALMHSGVAYYDAFWRETCVGRDLIRYFHDSAEDYPYFYRLVGNVMVTDSGVAYRYTAHDRNDSKDDNAAFAGVEVLTLRDGKILTVSNHYCDPRQECILELAELEASRHGESRYATDGLPFHRFLRLQRQVSEALIQNKLYLDPTLSLSQLAEQIGCSDDQLLQIMRVESSADFQDYLDQHRVRYARDMLRETSDDNFDLSHVATQVGFRSSEKFLNTFRETFGETPKEFVRSDTKKFESGGDSFLH